MKPMTLAIAALAAASTIAATLPVQAGEARASGNPAVHRGPGSHYAVIDRLVNGEYYEVEDCTRQARWCLVSEDGYELGWVRGSSLVGARAKVNVTPFEFLVNPDIFNKP